MVVGLVASLTWNGLRHGLSRRVIVAVGTAVAVVLPVVVVGAGSVVAAAALRQGVADLPAGQRSVIVSYNGFLSTPALLDPADAVARSGLGRLSGGSVRREMLFRQIADGRGGSFFLGATDGLAAAVHLTSGRLPAGCAPTRCEVVVEGPVTPRLDPALGLVVVGRVERTDPLLLTGTFDPGHSAPLLLSEGVLATSRLAALDVFGRSYGWVTPLDLRRVEQLGVAGYLARGAEVHDDLTRRSDGLVLVSPDNTLSDEDARARLSARRFSLLGGAGTVLLLGFAAVAAIGLRRDHSALQAVLRRRGATRAVRVAVTAVTALLPVAAGVVVGVAGGAVVVGWLAARAALPAIGAATHGAAAATPWALVVLVAATVVAGVVMAAPDVGDGLARSPAWRAVDVAVLVTAAAAVLAASRGGVAVAGLSSGTDPLLAALPALVAVCAGLVAARVWPVVSAAAGRLLPHRAVAGRLALLGAVRRPLRAAATVALVAAATTTLVLAGAYAATLARGAGDQAAAQVPLQATLTTGPSLDRPLQVAGLAAYAALVPGAVAHPVVRTVTGLSLSAAVTEPVAVVGVDPAALPQVHAWPRVAGGLPPAQAARLIAAPAARGLALPAGRVLTVPAAGLDPALDVTAYLRGADGDETGVHLTAAATGAAGRLTAPLPPGGGELVALVLRESPDAATHHQHAIGEGTVDVGSLAGRVTFGPPAVDGRAAATDLSQWHAPQATTTSVRSALTVDYRLTGTEVTVVPQAPADMPVLDVLADPVTAAHAVHGALTLEVRGTDPIRARVVGVVDRFPTTRAPFVVADRRAVAAAVDARTPGAGGSDEVWVGAPDGQAAAVAAALARPPFDRLSLTVRTTLHDRLATDPVAVGAARLLGVGALLALVLAAVSLVLLVVSDRDDDAAELYALEADGVAPSLLRRVLFVRAAVVALVGLPVGIAAGLVLARATTTLVAVTAVGSAPEPPLVLAFGSGRVAAVLGAGIAVALVVAAGVAATSLREPLPLRPEGDLR